jgi:hypothetical protein
MDHQGSKLEKIHSNSQQNLTDAFASFLALPKTSNGNSTLQQQSLPLLLE